MIKTYANIDEYLLSSNLGIEKNVEDFFIYDYKDVSENAQITENSFRQQYFELSLEINNGCSFQIDDFVIPLGEKRLSIVAPNRLQTVVAHDDLLEESQGFTIFFKPEFLGANLNQKQSFPNFGFLDLNQSPTYHLNDKQLAEMTAIFNLLRYEQNEYGEKSKEVIKNLVKAIFEKTKQLQRTSFQTSTRHPLVTDFLVLCNSHFLEFHTVNEFAQKLNVTPKHLTEVVRAKTGISALKTIHNAKIRYAKGLLSQTNLSIKEIAYELGFNNPEYFTVFFKRNQGQTPNQFRNI